MISTETRDKIDNEIEAFNKRAYNAGLSFKVREADKLCVYVQASFDFAYYVNAHLDFKDIIYTDLKEGDEWPDRWHDDQIIVITESEMDWIFREKDLDIDDIENCLCFQFNYDGTGFLRGGMVVCRSINIWWEGK